MQAKIVAKYTVSSIKKSIMIFYSIFISICTLLIILSKINGATITFSGVELSSAIFIFIAGLNLFKENFYFAKSNNITRKDYFLGTIASMLPVAGVMAIIDIVINRIFNLFISCPTNYDMIFTDLGNVDFLINYSWVQKNDIKTLFNTFLFQAAIYLMLFALGFVINMVYYKCNKLMKTVVSISPIMLVILYSVIVSNFHNLSMKINKFLSYIFGINPINPYASIITFIVLFISLVAIAYLLIRKMVIKER